jgi:hypothetical protein
MWPIDFFDQIGIWLQKQLGWASNQEHYRYVDGKIVRQCGSSVRGEIGIDEVVEWYSVPILGFDAVRILLK